MRRFSLLLAALVGTFVQPIVLRANSGRRPASGPIPLEHFTKFDEFGGVKISPDGEFLAVLTGKYGRSTSLFTDLKAKKIISGIRTPDDCEIDEYPLDLADAADLHDRAASARQGAADADRRNLRDQSRRQRQPAAVRLSRGGKHDRYAHQEARGQLRHAELLSSLKKDPDHILIAEYPWRKVTSGWAYNPDAKPLICPPQRVQRQQEATRHGAAGRRAACCWITTTTCALRIGRNEHQDLAVSWKPQPDSEWTGFELKDSVTRASCRGASAWTTALSILTGMREGDAYDALYRLDLQTQQLEKVHGFAASRRRLRHHGFRR